jgi:hypothetical protein
MGGVVKKVVGTDKPAPAPAPIEEKPTATTAQTDTALQRQAQARARRGGRALLGEDILSSKTTLGS